MTMNLNRKQKMKEKMIKEIEEEIIRKVKFIEQTDFLEKNMTC